MKIFLQFFSACNNVFKGRKRKNFAVYVKNLTLIIIKVKLKRRNIEVTMLEMIKLERVTFGVCLYAVVTCMTHVAFYFQLAYKRPTRVHCYYKMYMFLFCVLLFLTFNLGIKSGFIMPRLIIWYQVHLPRAWQYVS